MSDDNLPDEHFTNQIATRQSAVAAIKAEMERLRERFIPEVAKFAVGWWDDAARREVERNHVVTDNLTDEQLRALRAEVQALKENSDAAVRELFSDASAWWHLQAELRVPPSYTGSGDYSYSKYGNREPEVLDNAVRLALGKLGPILRKYGYLKSDRNGEFEWGEWDRSGNYRRPNGRSRFPYDLTWPPTLHPIVAEYARKKDEAERQLREITALEEQWKKVKARKRWDAT